MSPLRWKFTPSNPALLSLMWEPAFAQNLKYSEILI